MSHPPRLLLDDRGVGRTLFELWLPHIDPDAIWVVGGELPDGDLSRDVVPFVELSPLDVTAVAAEAGGGDLRILAVFCSVTALCQAAAMGLAPGRVTITSVGAEGTERRIGPSVHLSESEIDELAQAERRGFTFDIQGLPNVTARTWRPGEEAEG
jgi:mannose/fructose/N-acetylgalactosamine-specific phosphotransferase system component IIB